MTPLLPVAEALRRLLAGASPGEQTEIVALGDANHRVLAADVTARLTQPPFENSAMDGYAVRHADIAVEGSEIKVVGTSSAGHAFDGTVGPQEAVRIFTGAPLPKGADTVLIQEDAEIVAEGRIRPLFVPDKGRHIRPLGQDFALGETVLRKGDVLDAGRLTVAAGMNRPDLVVHARPKVAILATGDELVPPGDLPGPSQIIASSFHGVAAIARDNGADIIDLGIVRDDAEAIRAAVAKARDAGADIVVTLGGASVGDHDLVQSSLLSLGMVLDFWKIAMRPGKPLMVGRLDTMTVLGLPGNPVSSLVCAFLFLEPLVRHLASLPPRDRNGSAVLSSPLPENDKRQDYVRTRLVRKDGALPLATPFARQDSSMMQAFAASDALIVRPPHAPAAKAGETVKVLLLRDPG